MRFHTTRSQNTYRASELLQRAGTVEEARLLEERLGHAEQPSQNLRVLYLENSKATRRGLTAPGSAGPCSILDGLALTQVGYPLSGVPGLYES